MWFLLFLIITTLPLRVVDWINPKNLPIFESGNFHVEAAVALVIVALYLPLAFCFAAYGSDQLRRR